MPFTATEKTQVANLITAGSNNLTQAMRELGIAAGGQQDPTTLLQPALRTVATAIRETSLCLTFLSGAGAADSISDPPPPRPTAITNAWFHLDRAITFTDSAITALATAHGTNSVRARDISLRPGRTALAAVNRTLPYLDPSPPTLPPFPPGAIIGPHGNFIPAEWSSWRFGHYLLDMVDAIIPAYTQMSLQGQQAFFGKCPNVIDLSTHAIARWLDIDTTQQEKDNRAVLSGEPAGPFGVQFWLVLAMGELLTNFNVNAVNAPSSYQDLGDALGTAIAEPFRTAFSKILDSWKRMDRAQWSALLEFKDCDLQRDPAGCAQKLPSQNVALTMTTTITGPVTTVTATVKNGNGVVLDEQHVDVPTAGAPDMLSGQAGPTTVTYQRL